MKRVFKYCITLICFMAVERFCHSKTHGFSQHKIESHLPYHTEWETDADCSDVQNVLSQSFHFLDSGGESYVFLSNDGNYVLKFFKHHHMRPKSYLDPLLPSYFREKYRKFRMKKLESLFSSCKLAFEHFRDRTGLVYLHLNATDDLKIQLKLYDPIGVVHYLDLDTYTFALQKRAAPAFSTLTSLVEAHELDEAKERLQSMIDLILERCHAGIVDHDARKRNFGFIGFKAIEWDLGSFTQDDKLKNEKTTQRVLLLESMRIRSWIKKNAPELLETFDEKIKDHLTQKC